MTPAPIRYHADSMQACRSTLWLGFVRCCVHRCLITPLVLYLFRRCFIRAPLLSTVVSFVYRWITSRGVRQPGCRFAAIELRNGGNRFVLAKRALHTLVYAVHLPFSDPMLSRWR